ncbi:ribonuclease III [Algoriphagus halophytocola]|uniref:Ribonuclease 3 n=1 Tax=Algoriphagus halophytocola TaxID=2991499 RepID=A0ABY6MM02_9BACT|nr:MULTISPECIES: ribonuclease III [unclassified Algoriphagus]UZD24014.1 ribonuclease III [Algoriphagus sp. TR-M5]WBL41386.1 ribonuclease III [Algoriphagus sp. TR-M9]
MSKKDKRLAASIKLMTGSRPFNLSLYKLALTPSSLGEETSQGFRISNERLEFLGDAILGAVIAEYLFLKFPYRDEGFLTETRSKLVNRETLNSTGIKIGLRKALDLEIGDRNFTANKSLFGDMLEAFLGAIYLDKGYHFTKKFILQRILLHFDVESMISTTTNYKSKIIEWSQKENKEVEYVVLRVNGNQRFKEFIVALMVEGGEVAQGKGSTKKKAEQEASKNACETLNIAT